MLSILSAILAGSMECDNEAPTTSGPERGGEPGARRRRGHGERGARPRPPEGDSAGRPSPGRSATRSPDQRTVEDGSASDAGGGSGGGAIAVRGAGSSTRGVG